MTGLDNSQVPRRQFLDLSETSVNYRTDGLSIRAITDAVMVTDKK